MLQSSVAIVPRDETPSGSGVPSTNAARAALVAEGIREGYFVLSADHERWKWLKCTLSYLDRLHTREEDSGNERTFKVY